MLSLGRSPNTRLLSGSLDKMTVQERGNDMQTLKDTNKDIGRVETESFEPTKDIFREFLVQMTALVRAGNNVKSHFAAMVSVCNARNVPYNCCLRLEEMPEWMSCLRESLKLSQFTDSGRNNERTLRSDWYTAHNRGCWGGPRE